MAYVLSSISGNLISAASAGYAPTNSADVSAIASAYASGKQDTLSFGYDDDKISAINGSALAGEGGGTTYVSPSGTVLISGSSIEGTDSAYFPDREETNLAYSAHGFTSINTGNNAYTATGANIVYATGEWLNGTISALANNVLVAESAYVGEVVTMFSASADSGPLVLQSNNWWDMQSISAYTAGVTPASVVPLAHASSVSSKLDVSASSQFQPRGNYQSAGNYLSASTVGFTDPSYTAVTSMSGVQLYGTDSAFNGVAVASGNGLLDTAIETAIVGTGHSQVAVHINGMTGQYFDVSAVDSAGSLLSRNTYDLGASGKTFVFPSASAISSLYINGNRYYRVYDYTASAFDMIPLAHASALPTYQYDSGDKISAINGSALAGGGGGEADWSAESGQPGYIENKPVPKTLVAGAGITITENSTALVVGSTNTLYTAGSGLTLNGTTFSVDTAVVQGKVTYDYDASGNISGIDGSSLVGGDPEAADLYVQAPLYTGVSGGSAYIGSRINQTVLWTGTGTTTGGTITLSESLANFERYGMYYYIPYQESGQTYYQELVYKSGQTAFGIKTDGITNTLWRQYIDYGTMNETSISIVSGRQGGFWLTGTDRAFNLYDGNDRHHYFTKVIGINRTAGE
jgi:hypothetical protein